MCVPGRCSAMIRARVVKLLCLVLLVCISSLSYASDCTPWVAKAISIQGDVERRAGNDQNSSPATQQWRVIKRDDVLCAGDIIRVRQNSRAALILKNDTILRLNQNTTITLSSFSEEQSHWINLEQGIAHFIARIKQSFKVITPFVNAAVEGTEFVVSVNATQSEVTVFEGIVIAKNKRGEVTLTKGQTAVAIKNVAPTVIIKVKPHDAVQWSLFYPSIINVDIEFLQNFSLDTKIIIEQSVSDVQSGKITSAISKIESIPAEKINAELLTYKATLYLSIGQIEKAQQYIKLSMTQHGNNAKAIALQAIISLVQNDKAKALILAEQAATIAPDSPTSALTLSYVHQSLFDINTALKIIKRAASKNKNNSLLWSRLSELYLMTGELDKALDAAKQVNNLNPNIARAYSVLGFAYLASSEIIKAQQAFRNAIDRDDTDPLSRLGLGLVIIRQGNVVAGRRQLEFAASLDPDNSLIRSYLGKAYYEEHRYDLAQIQYLLAKQFDPNDPTPYYYNSILLNHINEPIKALREIEKSILLNNNRGVYRSNLLLDQDVAARNANIGDIYKNIGYQKLALNHASESITQNSRDSSAHYLLADIYRSKPRHEFASISENLQAKLLQPQNAHAVRPQQSESELTLVNNYTPTYATTNDYNNLFLYNGLKFKANRLEADRGTKISEKIISGIYDIYSFSIGEYEFATDGFHQNNQQETILHNYNVQAVFNGKTSIFIEGNTRSEKKGDIFRFDPDNFSKTAVTRTDRKRNRIGMKNMLSINDTILSTVLTEDRNYLKTTDLGFIGKLYGSTESSSEVYEIRYIHTDIKYKYTIGSNKKNTKQNTLNTLNTTVLSKNDNVVDDNSSYFYNYLSPGSTTKITLGVSHDEYKSGILTRVITNPKFGFLWTIKKDTNVRLAYFSNLSKNLVSGESLQPTMVAGFNQVYADTAGTKSRLFGIAFDHKFSNSISSGIEHTIRNLDVLTILNNNPTNEIWKEEVTTAYTNWIVTNNLNLSLGVEQEVFIRDGVSSLEFTNVNTIKVPVSINYYKDKFNFHMKFSHVEQQGGFIKISNGKSISDQDSFWITDITMNYKLPKSFGSITVGVKNIFNEKFKYFETDVRKPLFAHEKMSIAQINLQF